MYIIEVSPLGSGWKVSSDIIENDLVFARGSDAEASARQLAIAANLAGKAADVRILLRDGSQARSQRWRTACGKAASLSWDYPLDPPAAA